jgi:hypothetical protein
MVTTGFKHPEAPESLRDAQALRYGVIIESIARSAAREAPVAVRVESGTGMLILVLRTGAANRPLAGGEWLERLLRPLNRAVSYAIMYRERGHLERGVLSKD